MKLKYYGLKILMLSFLFNHEHAGEWVKNSSNIYVPTGNTMPKNSKIYIAGHTGLLGSAIVRLLQEQGFTDIITKTSKELDLRNQLAVDVFFERNKPEFIFLAAGKTGGSGYQISHSAEFAYDNLMIQTNIINAAHKYKTKKLLFLASSSIYPANSPYPTKEECWLTPRSFSKIKDTYTLAKIAGINLCQMYKYQYGDNFIIGIIPYIYGPNDNFDPSTGRIIPSLILKFFEAKKQDKPEILIKENKLKHLDLIYVDDCALACIFMMQKYDGIEIINIGTENARPIKEMSEFIAKHINYTGKIIYNSNPHLEVEALNLFKLHNWGWQHYINLHDGLKKTIDWYKANKN